MLVSCNIMENQGTISIFIIIILLCLLVWFESLIYLPNMRVPIGYRKGNDYTVQQPKLYGDPYQKH